MNSCEFNWLGPTQDHITAILDKNPGKNLLNLHLIRTMQKGPERYTDNQTWYAPAWACRAFCKNSLNFV